MQQRLPSLLDPPIAFAHRGARAHAPENTLEAFRLALRLGATGLESDVWLTADGVAVLDHDGEFRVRVRKRAVRDVSRDDLPAHIPTLHELLTDCGSSYHLSLDLKDPAAAETVVSVVQSVAPEMLERVWLCHPDRRLLAGLVGRVGGAKLVHSTRLDRLDGSPEQHAAALASDGVHGINLRRTDWNGGLVALFHRFELLAFGWDLQLEHHLRDTLRMGIDAVYSDYVDVMVDACRAEIGSW